MHMGFLNPSALEKYSTFEAALACSQGLLFMESIIDAPN